VYWDEIHGQTQLVDYGVAIFWNDSISSLRLTLKFRKYITVRVLKARAVLVSLFFDRGIHCLLEIVRNCGLRILRFCL